MDPKNPEHPRRASQPTPQQPSHPTPTEEPTPPTEEPRPIEAPGNPSTEYEREVPHEGNQPIARPENVGEASDHARVVATPAWISPARNMSMKK